MRPTPLSQNDLSWDNTRPIQYNGGLSGRTSHTMLVSAAAGRALYPYRATMDTGKTERICCYGEDVHANKQHRCQRGDLGRAWVWWGVLTRSGATISWRPPVLRYIIHHILVNPAMMGIPVRMTLSDHPVPGSTTLRKKNVTIKCCHPHELRHEVLAPKSKATAALQRFPSTQSKAGNLQRLRLSSLYSFSLFWSYSMRSLATSNRSPTES